MHPFKRNIKDNGGGRRQKKAGRCARIDTDCTLDDGEFYASVVAMCGFKDALVTRVGDTTEIRVLMPSKLKKSGHFVSPGKIVVVNDGFEIVRVVSSRDQDYAHAERSMRRVYAADNVDKKNDDEDEDADEVLVREKQQTEILEPSVIIIEDRAADSVKSDVVAAAASSCDSAPYGKEYDGIAAEEVIAAAATPYDILPQQRVKRVVIDIDSI